MFDWDVHGDAVVGLRSNVSFSPTQIEARVDVGGLLIVVIARVHVARKPKYFVIKNLVAKNV